MEPSSGDNLPSKQSREEEILELAKKELLREIKCASIRAEQFGAHSWAKPQKYVPSKRFLKHLIVNDSRFNDRREQQRRERDRDRRNSSYVETKREQSTKSYSRNKRKREIPSEDEDRYRPNKSEKSSYDKEKRHSRQGKHRKDSSSEIDNGGSSLEYVEKEKLLEKDEHCSPLSKHHKRKSKKHPKNKKSKRQK